MARKYKQGEQIKSVAQYESAAKTLTFFMVHGRTTHVGWIESWQYRTLQNIIKSGAMYEAIPIDTNKKSKEEVKDARPLTI